MPYDEPGPKKEEWYKYCGIYGLKMSDRYYLSSVTIRNGYLYLSWGGAKKLNEFKPGFFFTGDEEQVIFKEDTLFYGNRPAVKEKNSISEIRNLIKTDPKSGRLRENFLTDLGTLYLALGNSFSGLLIYKIITEIYLESIPEWKKFADVYYRNRNYERVLNIDSENAKTKNMINELDK